MIDTQNRNNGTSPDDSDPEPDPPEPQQQNERTVRPSKPTKERPPPTRVQPTRSRRPRSEWEGNLSALLAGIETDIDAPFPKTYKQAVNAVDADEWMKAIHLEYESHQENGTYELCELPEGRQAIKSKWVFVIKPPDGERPPRYKARWCGKGYSQIEGEDYFDTFAPVVSQAGIRIFLTIAAREDMDLSKVDADTAFLNGILDEEIYIEQPEGFIKPGEEHLVGRLRKAVYGLKQAGRVWLVKLDKILRSLGFVPLKSEQCIYVNKERQLIILVYVDDMGIGSKRSADRAQFLKDLSKEIKIKDLGEMNFLPRNSD